MEVNTGQAVRWHRVKAVHELRVAIRRFRVALRVFGDRVDVSLGDARVEEVHALRRRCRRIRYLSEFAEPILGRSVHKLTQHLKGISTSLGKRHDADMQTHACIRDPRARQPQIRVMTALKSTFSPGSMIFRVPLPLSEVCPSGWQLAGSSPMTYSCSPIIFHWVKQGSSALR